MKQHCQTAAPPSTATSAKSYGSGKKIAINGTNDSTFKGSNGVANTLYLPSGVKADRITLYSYVNGTGTNVSGWKEVNGTQDDYEKIPMAAKSASIVIAPDVRVYSLDNASEIKFNNAGYQLCFVISLDVVEEPVEITADITIGTYKAATYCNASAWQVPTGMEEEDY